MIAEGKDAFRFDTFGDEIFSTDTLRMHEANGVDTLTRVGIACALCHSTVDDPFARGIGQRRDGWPNRDLDPGAIIALSPALDADGTELAYWTRYVAVAEMGGQGTVTEPRLDLVVPQAADLVEYLKSL